MCQMIHELEPDIVFIQEPYLSRTSKRVTSLPPGYMIQHQLSDDHAYGAIIIHKRNLQIKQIPHHSSNEIAAVEITCQNQTIACYAVYCRPSTDSIRKVLLPLLQRRDFKGKDCIISVDSNSHNLLWNSSHTDTRGRDLENIIVAHDLNICNLQKRHLNYVPTNTTFVDITITGDNIIDKITDWRYLSTPSFSDHHYIYFVANLEPRKKKPTNHALPKLSNTDAILGKQLLIDQLDVATQLHSKEQIESAVENLTNVLRSSINGSFVPPARLPTRKRTPWWTRELYNLRQQLRKSRRQLYQNSGTVTTDMVQQLKAAYQREMRKAKASAWKRFCTEEFNEDPYKAVKKAAGKLQTEKEVSMIRTPEGQLTTSATEILTALAETFFPKDKHIPDPSTLMISGKAHEIISIFQQMDVANIPHLSENELDRAILSMKKNKAPGRDGITAEHVQHYYGTIKTHLQFIINACLQLSYFPTKWKEAQVLTIPKPGKPDYSDPKAYRPISLLPVLGKVLEKVILARLQYHDSVTNWFSENQHGFRSGKSTVTALQALIKQASHGFNMKAFTACALLDIQGAFDNTWHDSIIANLEKNNCPRYLNKMIQSFLSERTAVMQLHETEITVDIERGCPQGSTLSPMLWNIVIDDALRLNLPPGVKIQAFADDLIITKTGCAQLPLQQAIQRATDQLINWGKGMKLEFSGPKTELIIFTRKQKTFDDFHITVNGIKIDASPTVKYLGVTLDSKMTWKDHIELKCIKTKQTIMNLRRYSKLTWGANRNILSKLYESIAKPMLLYAASIWVNATKFKWCKTRLRSVQRLMLMTTCRSFKSISTKSVLVLTNSLPMEMTAQDLATRAAIKAADTKNPLILSILEKSGVDQAAVDKPSNSYLCKLPPYSHYPFTVNWASDNFPSLFPTSTNVMHVFTDGSKMPGKTGYAVIFARSNGSIDSIKQRLPNSCNIFEAEAYAIQRALNETSKKVENGSSVSIYTDSKSVLQAIVSHGKSIAAITSIQMTAFELTKSFNIQFTWIPGHRNIEGNEMADRAAKEAASSQEEPQQAQTSWSLFKDLISKHFWNVWSSEWIVETESSKITKRFFPTTSAAQILKHKHLPHQLIQILSGHSRLRTFLHRINASENSTCNCGQEETTEHFLFHCTCFNASRAPFKSYCIRHLRTWPPLLSRLVADELTLTKLKLYILSTKRLDF